MLVVCVLCVNNVCDVVMCVTVVCYGCDCGVLLI